MAVPPRQHAVSHLQARYQRAPPAPLPLPADEPCRPWLCPVGALAGQYLTAELEEVQKADFARKMSSIMGKGTVDARALDPRPVVRARLFTCDPNGGNRVEIEPDPDTKELTAFNGQLICKAGLYPYNRDFERDGDLTRFAGGRVTPSPLLPSSAPPQAELASEFAYPPATLARAPARPLGPHCEMAYALSGMRDLRARECQAYHEPVGKVALYFVFEDLRVSEVGHFVLKYSLIFLDNAFVARPDIKPPVLAKCWGGVFAIYPSKKAPPKEKSTDFGMFLYTNNLLSRPHTEKPANKRKAAQAEKEKEREKAAAHSLSSAHPSAHPSTHPSTQASIFHPFPPPSGLGAGPASMGLDAFAQPQQGGSRQPQPPSYTFPFPPGAFPHAPGRDEGPLPRITVDSIRRAEAGGSGAGLRREEELSPRREEVSPRAREQEARASVQEVHARGQPESSVRGRGYADEPMRDDFVDERESMRYSPRRREGVDQSPRRRQDDESPRRRQERNDNSPRRRSASPRRSPPRTAANGQHAPTPPRRASPPPRCPTPDEPLPRPTALPTANANASRTSTDRASTSTSTSTTSRTPTDRAPTSSNRAPTSTAPASHASSAPTPTPAPPPRAAGTKPAAVSAAELRAQELEGIALAQARHEAWLRAQYDPPPAPAPVDIPPDVLAAAAALADDGGSEGSGPGAGAVEELGEPKEGALRVVAQEREGERDEERVVVERRRLKFDPVRDS